MITVFMVSAYSTPSLKSFLNRATLIYIRRLTTVGIRLVIDFQVMKTIKFYVRYFYRWAKNTVIGYKAGGAVRGMIKFLILVLASATNFDTSSLVFLFFLDPGSRQSVKSGP